MNLKYFHIGIFVLILSACGSSDSESSTKQTPVQTAPTPAVTNDVQPPPPTPEPAQNAAGVWHYTCPNGHAGGAGSATTCAECGATLQHNTAYHNNASSTTINNVNTTSSPTPTVGGTPPSMFADPSKSPVNATIGTQVTPATSTVNAEPAQNATGVWHYTCPKGCSGGGGSATACSQCGATLAHNQAYHN